MVLAYFYKYQNQGPIGIPFFGVLFSYVMDPYRWFHYNAVKYGAIMSKGIPSNLHSGTYPTIAKSVTIPLLTTNHKQMYNNHMLLTVKFRNYSQLIHFS